MNLSSIFSDAYLIRQLKELEETQKEIKKALKEFDDIHFQYSSSETIEIRTRILRIEAKVRLLKEYYKRCLKRTHKQRRVCFTVGVALSVLTFITGLYLGS